MKIMARCPGTCGEFIQGNIDGQEMLVSPAINLYSTVQIEYNNNKTVNNNSSKRQYSKIWRSLQRYASLHQLKTNWDWLNVTVESSLAVGKGMASSTADIYAALMAFAHLWEKPVLPEEMAEIATSVEPTDSIGFAEWTLMAPENGKVFRRLGDPMFFSICLLEEQGMVETISYSSNRDLIPDVSDAFTYLQLGIEIEDIALVAKGSKISAQKNQNVLYKPYLDQLIQYCEHHALGFNIAHTGTVAGIWFNTAQQADEYKDEIFRQFQPYFTKIQVVETVYGNPEIIDVRRR